MALRPCSVCRRLYRGSAQHAYPALLRGTERVNRSVSLCDDCFTGVQVFTRDHLTEVNYDAPPDADEQFGMCAWCGSEVASDKWTVFVTLYPRKSDRADFFGMVHDACAQKLALGVGLAVQVPLKIAS